MPRLSKLDTPGVLHHVMGRDIERRKIFHSDINRNDFIGRLSALAQEGGMEIRQLKKKLFAIRYQKY